MTHFPMLKDLPAEETSPACAICQGETTAPVMEHNGRPVCDSCHERIVAYTERLESRVDRLRSYANKLSDQGNATYNRARQMADVIPFGQPILIGHHSEKADRRYRDRIHNTYGRAFAAMERAAEIERKADRVGKNRAISSDDPAAIIKLEEKLAKLQQEQDAMKRANAAIRKLVGRVERIQSVGHHGTVAEINARFNAEKARVAEIHKGYLVHAQALAKELGISEGEAAVLLTPDILGRIGYADYELKNNGAEIRRITKRIDSFRIPRTTIAENVKESVYGDIRVERSVEDNRLRIHFPGKPAPHIINLLKSRGFRWSPSNKAWQRQLTANAEYDAVAVIQEALKK